MGIMIPNITPTAIKAITRSSVSMIYPFSRGRRRDALGVCSDLRICSARFLMTGSRRVPLSQRYVLRRTADHQVLDLNRCTGNSHNLVAAVDDLALAGNENVRVLGKKNLSGFSGLAGEAEELQGYWKLLRHSRWRIYRILSVRLAFVRCAVALRNGNHGIRLGYKNVSSRAFVTHLFR